MCRLILVGVCLLSVARSASGAPIQITSGSMSLTSGYFSAGFSDGLHFTGGIGGGASAGFIGPYEACLGGCVLPVVFNSGNFIAGVGTRAIVTWDGVTYGPFGSVDSPHIFSIQFSGPGFPVPGSAPFDEFVILERPFALTGFFTLILSNNPFESLSHSFVGEGTGMVTLRRGSGELRPGVPAYSLQSAVYTFHDPVVMPEPATLVLIGGPVALGLWRRRRRLKSRRC